MSSLWGVFFLELIFFKHAQLVHCECGIPVCFVLFSPELLIFKLLNFEWLFFSFFGKKITFESNNPTFRHNFVTNVRPIILVRVTRFTYSLWFFGNGCGLNQGMAEIRLKCNLHLWEAGTRLRLGGNTFLTFFCAQSCNAVFLQSHHFDPPKYPVCWVQQSSCSGMLLLFWENNTANCLD